MKILTKLTLRIDGYVLEKIDKIAHKHGKSREELLQEIIITFAEFHDE